MKPDGTRTPSPPGTYESTAMAAGTKNEADVPSPVPASISSTTTTSSEPSHSQHGSHAYTPSVPNPFAAASAPAPGWVSHASVTATASAPPGSYTHSAPPTSANPQPQQHPHHGAIPMVVSAPAPPPQQPPAYHPQHHAAPTQHTWSRENSCPNFSIGSTDPHSPKSAARGIQTATRKRYSSKAASSAAAAAATATNSSLTGGTDLVEDSVNCRRQKRLERNRESARLSRRRRKQYLEILEDRVTQLSTELDQGRRAHAAQAVTVTLNKRREILTAPGMTDEERIRIIENGLGRTSAEMMLLTTFKCQQLKSFSLPPQSKFILWLTLQNDQYFRGGRAASERLSAARIGERMLNSGNDRVPPAQSMWPLFCNEIGLSYDQEERVRHFQRTLLQNQDSWLQRHTAQAASLAMSAVHDSSQAMTLRVGQQDRSMRSVLTPGQKVKLLSWADNNREKLQRIMQARAQKHTATNSSSFIDPRFKADKNQHVAANLYIVNHQLQRLMQKFPRASPLVTGATLKKLSRRPSFESLGRSPADRPGKEGSEASLSRDTSFASSSSLKRSCSSLSMDGERPQLQQISPDDAEATCGPGVEKVLGYIREIIPATAPVQYVVQPAPVPPPSYPQQHHQHVVELRIPSPTVVTTNPYHPPTVTLQPQYTQAPAVHHQPMAQAPVPMTIVSTQPAVVAHPLKSVPSAPGHKKQSSFIPPYLNVVPEEMFPTDGTADDFLMTLTDEDWAIGEGVDMDTTS